MKKYLKSSLLGLLLLINVTLIGGLLLSFAINSNDVYYEGQSYKLSSVLPDKIESILSYQSSNGEHGRLNDLSMKSVGDYDVRLKLFGVVPIKDVSITVAPDMELVPGGQSVGIMLKARGSMVVGFSSIVSSDGKTYYPARDSGIELGDGVLAVNGVKIKSDQEALKLINKYGEKGEVVLTLSRGNDTIVKRVKSIYCVETKTNRIGLYIRDSIGGVGTMTFYDKKSKRFGALGHKINEASMSPEDIKALGRLVPSEIKGIKPSIKGFAGEKMGIFSIGDFNGKIDVLGEYGVFGTLDNDVSNPIMQSVTPARPDQITKGTAKIITVLNGQKLELFDVEIIEISRKGMKIKIIDPRLLSETGGIIQGMSGSPIIQNNLLVGAITHVLVDTPMEGYGCFLSDMLEECGLL